MNFEMTDFSNKGLYLAFGDSNIMDLSRNAIDALAEQYWHDPEKLPEQTKGMEDFRACSICPRKDAHDLCQTLKPVLPILANLDSFVSYDMVDAVYRDEDELLHIARSTMANALQYVSMLGLTEYCATGRKYRKYYDGIIPIAGMEESIKRIYLNIYWLHKGNMPEIKEVIKQFNEEITLITGKVIKRLGLICKSDAFLNAFYNAQVGTELLTLNMEELMQKTFTESEL